MILIPPREKADYLIVKFNINGLEQAKRSVLIMITEIVNLLYFIEEKSREVLINYLIEVADEIKKYEL